MDFKYIKGNKQTRFGGVWTLPGSDFDIVLEPPLKGQAPCSEMRKSIFYDPKNPPRLSTAPSLDASDMLKQAEDLEKRAESLLRRMKDYR